MAPTTPGLLTAAARLLGTTIACLTAAGVLAAGPAPAASSASASLVDSQVRISAERAAANARYAEQERECRTRFIVSSCIDAAKRERRQELDRLRARQIVVDEARRRERADTRRAELASKAAEDAKREADRSARAASAPASGAASQPPRGRLLAPGKVRGPALSASGSSGAASGAAASRPRTPGKALGLGGQPPASAAEREAEAVRKRAAFEARQRKAAEHRDEAAAQAVRRMSTKTPASSLPAPGSASAAKR